MKTLQRTVKVVIALVMALTGQPAMAGYDVGSKFADVIIEYITPGKVYNLRTMQSLPYRIENRAEDPVELIVHATIPSAGQLRPGYEAIPDLSWIRCVPGRFKLAKGEEGLVDIILQVPEGKEYVGHHYQAHITAVTPEAAPGDKTALSFGISLSSRLRFSVGSAGPDEIKRLQKQGIYKVLNFTLEPDLQYVPGFNVPGKKVSLADAGIRVSIVNRSSQDLQFSLKPVPVPGGMGASTGYEFGDPSWIKVLKPSLKVPGESIKGSDLELDLPNDPKIRGKRYMFVIQAGLEGREIPIEVYSRVYINVAQ